MNTMGCRPLVGLTHRVSTRITAARARAFQLTMARPAAPVFSKVMATTDRPAAATIAVDAGRRP